MAVSAWILNDTFPIDWVPRSRVERGTLISTDALTIDLMDDTTYYVFCLVVLALVAFAVRGIRRSRTGRAIIALRENERAAQSYSLSAVRVKLTAFVISGTIAGIAGGLFVHYSFVASTWRATSRGLDHRVHRRRRRRARFDARCRPRRRVPEGR